MPRPIKLTAFKEQIAEQIQKQMQTILNSNACNTKLTFNFDVTEQFKKMFDGEAAIVNFTASAYCKMMLLVQQSGEELAAHGIVNRISPYEYTVTDILVYPQEVTGTTVTAADEYSKWLMDLADSDEDAFDNMRFQMHSHVHMGTSPSGTDTNFYEEMLKDVEDYYIFFIMNKRNEFFINIYDVEKNLIFEQKDIDVYIVDEDGEDITSWAKGAIKDNIKPKRYGYAQNNGTPAKDTIGYDRFSKYYDKDNKFVGKPDGRTREGKAEKRKQAAQNQQQQQQQQAQLKEIEEAENAFLRKYGCYDDAETRRLLEMFHDD